MNNTGTIQAEEAQPGVLIGNCLVAKNHLSNQSYHKYYEDACRNASILRNSDRNRKTFVSCLYKREKMKKKLRQ